MCACTAFDSRTPGAPWQRRRSGDEVDSCQVSNDQRVSGAGVGCVQTPRATTHRAQTVVSVTHVQEVAAAVVEETPAARRKQRGCQTTAAAARPFSSSVRAPACRQVQAGTECVSVRRANERATGTMPRLPPWHARHKSLPPPAACGLDARRCRQHHEGCWPRASSSGRLLLGVTRSSTHGSRVRRVGDGHQRCRGRGNARLRRRRGRAWCACSTWRGGGAGRPDRRGGRRGTGTGSSPGSRAGGACVLGCACCRCLAAS